MRALVSCYEVPAAEVGRQILAAGGSVVDAAIATAYAQVVANPFMCGLSGKASIHVRNGATGEALILDAGHIIGSRATPTVFADRALGRQEKVGSFRVQGLANWIGYQAIMTPGFVPATQQLYERFGSGRLSWEALLAPAVRLARDGFPIYPQLVRFWDEQYVAVSDVGWNLRTKVAPNAAATALLFKPGGRRYQNGELFRQPDLAHTLQRIAVEGPELFYRGDIARQVAGDIAAHGGFVTYDDMANFPVETKEPIRITYRGYEIAANPPPGNGIVALIMLNILEGYDLAAMDRRSPQYAELLARAMQCAFDDRARYRGDPRFVDVPVDRLLSKEHAAQWRSRIDTGQIGAVATAPASSSTTHLTVMDADGSLVTMTHSIGGAAGAGVVTEGLGFLHNNHMALFNPLPGTVDSIVPGKRQGGSVPIVVYRDGEPVLAIGGAGGTRQVSGTVQSILNVLDWGMGTSEAVAAPRLHSEQEDVILMEPGWPEATVRALEGRGYRVDVLSGLSDFLGWINAVGRDPRRRTLDGGTEIRGAHGRGFVGYHEDE
ncbi:MAG TPA: gamma-glutamyltransferase [Anaerolineae bacterium]|nr:gamma-glutamyltransferase [Anaerolineae bacterium]